jgi:hypothetical protein
MAPWPESRKEENRPLAEVIQLVDDFRLASKLRKEE